LGTSPFPGRPYLFGFFFPVFRHVEHFVCDLVPRNSRSHLWHVFRFKFSPSGVTTDLVLRRFENSGIFFMDWSGDKRSVPLRIVAVTVRDPLNYLSRLRVARLNRGLALASGTPQYRPRHSSFIKWATSTAFLPTIHTGSRSREVALRFAFSNSSCKSSRQCVEHPTSPEFHT
jgi:hypothetical protein